MMSLNHDVLVVGGGPAGLLAANNIARQGHRVMILEEHESIGSPDHCAGLLSTTGLQSLELRPPKTVIQNHVEGAIIHSPSGHKLQIRRGRREALVINRVLFDCWLAKRAENSGAEMLLENHVKTLRELKNESQVLAEVQGQGNHKASIVVIAEGNRGILPKTLGLPVLPRKFKYPAYQYEVSGVSIDQKYVEMYYGREWAPGFFAWLIPIGEGRARVGLASKDRAKARLLRFLKKHPIASDKLRNAKVERGFGGAVLVGMPISRTYTDNAVVVGDAAGHVKATTGGGVILGGKASLLAAEVVNRALSRGVSSSEYLSHYEKQWKGFLMKEFRLMYLVQRGITSLSDKGLDELITLVDDHSLLDVVHQKGDMDMQGHVIKSIFKNPKSLLVGLRVVGCLNPFL